METTLKQRKVAQSKIQIREEKKETRSATKGEKKGGEGKRQ